MKTVWLIAGVIAAFIIQSRVAVVGVAPALTAAAAYYFGITRGASKGILAGSFIGMIEDSIGGHILGPNLLGKGLVGFFSSLSSGSLFRWTPLLGMISIFVLTIVDGIIVLLARAIFETAPASFSHGAFALFLQALFNIVIGVLIRPKNVD